MTEPYKEPDSTNMPTGRARSLLNLNPPFNSETGRIAAKMPRKMTAAAIRQRKLARIAGLMTTQLNPEKLASLRLKQALLEGATKKESLKIAALEVLATLGDCSLYKLEDKLLILKMIVATKDILA